MAACTKETDGWEFKSNCGATFVENVTRPMRVFPLAISILPTIFSRNDLTVSKLLEVILTESSTTKTMSDGQFIVGSGTQQ